MTRSIAGRSIPPPAEFCRRARIAYRTPRKLQSSRSTGCYNPAGPMVRRRVGLTVMLALLIIGVLLSVLPWHAGAIRLAGVSVTWWVAVASTRTRGLGRPARHRRRRGCRRDRGESVAGVDAARLPAGRRIR